MTVSNEHEPAIKYGYTNHCVYACIYALHNHNVLFWQRILQQSNFRVKLNAEWSRYTAIHQ